MSSVNITEAWLAKLAADETAGRPAELGDGVGRLLCWDAALPGFGVVIGQRFASFVVQHRVGGKQRRVTIGRYQRPGAGEQRADLWTVARARRRALELLGSMSSGIDPQAEERKRDDSPTLRDGLVLHTKNMRKAGRSPRSIETIESEVPRLLETWLDRAIVDLRGVELVALHDKLSGEGKRYLANRIVAHVSAIWNAIDKVHELDTRNPARAVTRNRYKPNRTRVADDELANWHARVRTLTPVRRDLQLFCLFTAMRSEAARHVRWEHVDWKRGALLVPKPKGGEEKEFTLPLAKRTLAMLRERKRDNAITMSTFGGDHGWVFPSLSRARVQLAPDGPSVFVVQPLAEPKEYRVVESPPADDDADDTKPTKRAFLPGLHVLRRTFLSVATEAGIGELDRHCLANHSFGRQSVNSTYIKQAFPHLAECQERIASALWQRMNGRTKTQRRKRAA